MVDLRTSSFWSVLLSLWIVEVWIHPEKQEWKISGKIPSVQCQCCTNVQICKFSTSNQPHMSNLLKMPYYGDLNYWLFNKFVVSQDESILQQFKNSVLWFKNIKVSCFYQFLFNWGIMGNWVSSSFGILFLCNPCDKCFRWANFNILKKCIYSKTICIINL